MYLLLPETRSSNSKHGIKFFLIYSYKWLLLLSDANIFNHTFRGRRERSKNFSIWTKITKTKKENKLLTNNFLKMNIFAVKQIFRNRQNNYQPNKTVLKYFFGFSIHFYTGFICFQSISIYLSFLIKPDFSIFVGAVAPSFFFWAYYHRARVHVETVKRKMEFRNSDWGINSMSITFSRKFSIGFSILSDQMGIFVGFP